MILRILLTAYAVLLPSVIAIKSLNEFYETNLDKCLQNDPFRLLGQETPLSNTLENFIAMAEKFETANPNVDLNDELHYFISQYLFENVEITSTQLVNKVHIDRLDYKNIESMWEYDDNRDLQVNEPFSDDERCSLYLMISHSMLLKDSDKMRSSTNETIFRNGDLLPENYYPQEVGVVAVPGSDAPVALGKVLLGLHVGMKPERKTRLGSYNIIVKNVTQETLDKNVDVLYATTIADVLMLSSFEGFYRKGLAGNGQWLSVPLQDNSNGGEGIEGFCPMVYKHADVEKLKDLPGYSIASVRGGADGLILGLVVQSIQNAELKLSHILRMYYSPRGIIFNDNIEDLQNVHQVSFCNREQVIKVLEPNFQDQMLLYGYLVSQIYVDIQSSYNRANRAYQDNYINIYNNRAGNGYCAPDTSLDKPENLTPETFLDIIIVMDTSNSEKNFLDQQLIVGYLARQLDLRYYGSRMTVLLDHRINLDSGPGGSSKIDLKPVVNYTYSSSCAACTVAQLNYEKSTVQREDVVIAVDQLLQEMKDNETDFNGVNGKVVIFFNYENDDNRANNNRIQTKVQKALTDLNLRHRDVLVYAVGLDLELLKKYAKDDPSLVFLGSQDKPAQVANNIFKKISYAPALIQYKNCMDGKNEKGATYETFVSPSKIQHYTVPAEYFYKSFNLKFLFESPDGQIRVCYNRATMRPELEAKHCKETTQGTTVEFRMSNPCKGFYKENCAPMYFSVIGKDPMDDNNGNQAPKLRSTCKANDRMCSTLDQIKFKVSHEGVRCNGSLGLNASAVSILFTILFTYFLNKK